MDSITYIFLYDLQTAATLTFVIYLLAEHPQVMTRLREEILHKIGTSRRPTYDDFRDMKYMRAVINGEAEFPGYCGSS